MRVLIVNTLYPPLSVGGAERSVSALAESLVRLGISVSILSLHEGKIPVQETIEGVKIFRLPLERRYWPYRAEHHRIDRKIIWHLKDIDNLKVGEFCKKLLEAEKIDVIHTNNLVGLSTSVWKNAAAVSVPILHTVRDYSLICPRTTMFRSGKPCESVCFTCSILSRQRRRMSGLVCGVIGVSAHMVKEHAKLGFFPKAKFSGSQFNSIEAGRNFPVPRPNVDGMVRFGFVGRVALDKGVETLLDALEQATQDPAIQLAWSLSLFGTGEETYIRKLRTRWSDNRIVFHGHTNAEAVYKDLDVIVVPSIWREPLSRVIIEALWRGIRVIASDSGGSPELIGADRTGRLFKSGNVGALRDILVDVLVKGRDSIPSPARDDPFFRQTSAEATAQAYAQYYMRALGRTDDSDLHHASTAHDAQKGS